MKKRGLFKISILIVITITVLISINFLKSKTESNTNRKDVIFQDEETEKIVRNITNTPKGKLDEDFHKEFNSIIVAFDGKCFLSKNDNDNDMYYLHTMINDDTNLDKINESSLYNEKYIRKILIVYDDTMNDDLSFQDIQKCVKEGNVKKKDSINKYSEWWEKDFAAFNQVLNENYNDENNSNSNALCYKYENRKVFDLSDDEFREVYEILKDKFKERLKYKYVY